MFNDPRIQREINRIMAERETALVNIMNKLSLIYDPDGSRESSECSIEDDLNFLASSGLDKNAEAARELRLRFSNLLEAIEDEIAEYPSPIDLRSLAEDRIKVIDELLEGRDER